MTRAKFAPNPQQLLTDAAGPGNAYYAYYYEPDGAFSTQKTVYKDAAKSTSWTQPVTVGADGRPVGADVFLDGDYDRRIYDSDDNLIRSEQNIGDTWSAVGTDLSENLLSNASFETAGAGSEPFENWTATDSGSVITRDTTDSYHGFACALFTNSNNGSDYILSDLFEVSPGRDVSLSFYVKSSNASAIPLATISWHDKDQAFISSSTIYKSNSGLTPTSWDLIQGIRATPVSTARYATIALYGNNAATQYTTRFDELRIFPVSRYPEEAPFAPYGLNISRDSGDTDHDLKITAGAVKSDDYADDIILTDDIVKRMDAGFTAGTGNGAGESGFSLPSEGDYAIWLIKNSETGNVDVLASTSYSSPTMPSGYDVKRRIGYWVTDSSNNNVAGQHSGNVFIMDMGFADVTDTSMTDDTAETATLSVPPNSLAIIISNWEYSSGNQANFRNTIITKGFTNHQFIHLHQVVTTNLDEYSVSGIVLVNSDSQVDYKCIDGTAGALSGEFQIYTRGCIDLGRDSP